MSRSGKPNAGFSTGAPWLPVDPRHDSLAVDKQEANQWSMLHFVRKLISIRRESGALRVGSIAFHRNPEGVIAFSREFEGERLVCVFNVGESEKSWSGQDLSRMTVAISTGAGHDGARPPASLPAFSGYIAHMRA
jgi:alpha-glucosidase